MQRKSVTISRNIYLMLKNLPQNDRHIILDLILENLFDGKKPELKEDDPYDQSIKNAFICLNYELNQIQKQFENGKKSVLPTQKKSMVKNTQSLCPFDDPHIDPLKPTLTHDFSSDYYNYQITNIIYYIINQSVSPSEFFSLKKENLSKLDSVLEQIEQICESSGITKLTNAVKKLTATDFVKVGGVTKSSIEVLDKIIGLMLQPSSAEQIKLKLKEIAEVSSIKSPVNYLISSLFNLAIDFENSQKRTTQTNYKPKYNQQNNNVGFMTRNYTKEEFEALYDSVDDVDI